MTAPPHVGPRVMVPLTIAPFSFPYVVEVIKIPARMRAHTAYTICDFGMEIFCEVIINIL
jgi:hypothetical protein